jgi:hypothetical protein
MAGFIEWPWEGQLNVFQHGQIKHFENDNFELKYEELALIS